MGVLGHRGALAITKNNAQGPHDLSKPAFAKRRLMSEALTIVDIQTARERYITRLENLTKPDIARRAPEWHDVSCRTWTVGDESAGRNARDISVQPPLSERIWTLLDVKVC
jgi:broad specificity phosphatase PhoE